MLLEKRRHLNGDIGGYDKYFSLSFPLSFPLPWERGWWRSVNEMVLRMQYSGYSEKFRYDVVNSALRHMKRERKLIKKEKDRYIDPENGRERSETKKKRGREATSKRKVKRGGNLCTPNSQLQRRYQKEIKRQGFKIKVVEKAVVAIKKLLQRSDTFKSRKCVRGDCPVCREDGLCDRQSVTYDIKCAECNDNYIGEASRSAYTR